VIELVLAEDVGIVRITIFGETRKQIVPSCGHVEIIVEYTTFSL
jgi:hypothetical protein